MMPPKMVPRALVSLGIRTTRMAGWRGPAVRVAVSSMPSCYPRPPHQGPPTEPGMSPTPSLNPLETMNDAALLRLVADRNSEALGVLYGRYAPTLLALGKRVLGSLGEAEEVLQEIFLYVWNHAARYDASRSSVSTWLVL